MIFSWIIVGAFIGWLLGLVTNTEKGCLLNLVFSIIGSILGGVFEFWLNTGELSLIGYYDQYSLVSLFFAIIGALVLFFILYLFRNLIS